jgi:hypothetical protein
VLAEQFDMPLGGVADLLDFPGSLLNPEGKFLGSTDPLMHFSVSAFVLMRAWVLARMFSKKPATPLSLWSKCCPSLRGFEIVYRNISHSPPVSQGRKRRLTFRTFSYSFAWTLWSFSTDSTYSSK